MRKSGQLRWPAVALNPAFGRLSPTRPVVSATRTVRPLRLCVSQGVNGWFGSSAGDGRPVRTNGRLERRPAAVHEFYQSIPADYNAWAITDVQTTPPPAKISGQPACHDPTHAPCPSNLSQIEEYVHGQARQIASRQPEIATVA